MGLICVSVQNDRQGALPNSHKGESYWVDLFRPKGSYSRRIWLDGLRLRLATRHPSGPKTSVATRRLPQSFRGDVDTKNAMSSSALKPFNSMGAKGVSLDSSKGERTCFFPGRRPSVLVQFWKEELEERRHELTNDR